MKLIYHLSDAARKRMFVETGIDPQREQSIDADPATLSIEHRRLLTEINPSLFDKVTLQVSIWNEFNESTSPLTIEAVITDPAELLAVYADARAAGEATVLKALNGRVDRAIAEFQAWSATQRPGVLNEGMYRKTGRLAELRAAFAVAEARAADLSAEARRQREAEKAREAAEREAHEAEKRAWIEAHGSDFLRRACLKGGYDCQRRYVTERAATERPGYVVDFHDKAQWKDRACPSERALDEAERAGGQVVWLTTYPVDDGNPDEYEGGWEQESEAVVIRGYLGKYDLIKLM